jgi:hypothetical protein
LNWRKANYEEMREFLYSYRWAMNAETDVNEDWEEFKSVMATLIELFIPVAKVRSQKRPKWITSEIIRLLRKKKRAWKLAKNYNMGKYVEIYKRVEK